MQLTLKSWPWWRCFLLAVRDHPSFLSLPSPSSLSRFLSSSSVRQLRSGATVRAHWHALLLVRLVPRAFSRGGSELSFRSPDPTRVEGRLLLAAGRPGRPVAVEHAAAVAAAHAEMSGACACDTCRGSVATFPGPVAVGVMATVARRCLVPLLAVLSGFRMWYLL